MRQITFLTDYGLGDEFVGVCRLVIASLCPGAHVVDIGHGASGVRAGAAMLAQAVPYAPADAVHLVVVDPGVGTRRRPVVVRAASGADLVGPDNGVLLDAALVLGGVSAVHELRADPPLGRLSATFHGRDVFAPAAARLAGGAEPATLGTTAPHESLVRLPEPLVVVADGMLEAEVLRADGFGNVQLAARADALAAAALGPAVDVRAAGRSRPAVLATTFADARPGELVVLVDSADQVAVAVNGGSAWTLLGRPSSVTVARRSSRL